MEELKQRAVTFTDSEWADVMKASKKSKFRSNNQFVRDAYQNLQSGENKQ